MKYLKLYEDFNNQDDILYDIETILEQLLHDSNSSNRYVKRLGCELDGDLIFYELDTECSEEDLRVAKLRLNDLNYKIVYFNNNYCWIVNIDILSDEFKDSDETGQLKNSKMGDNIKKLRKYLLFKYWEKTPMVSEEILKLFLNKTDLAYGDTVFLSSLFRDFLGLERIKEILNEILDKNKYYDISEGGYLYDHHSDYNFNFKIEDFNISDYTVFFNCVVDYPSATITTDGNELNILDIYDDEDTTSQDIVDIDNQLTNCLSDFLSKKVWPKTGLNVEAEILNIN